MTRRTTRIIGAITLLAGVTLAPWRTNAEPKFSVQSNVQVTMSDGVTLATDIYLPDGGERFPTVFIRTPYDKRSTGFAAEPLASRGFAVAVQDVRGMGASEGTFIPFLHEKQDGLEALDWIAKQDWCDGNIGMWGTSYLGYTALVLSPSAPANLKAIVNVSGWGNTKEMTSPGGALHLMVGLPWTLAGQIRGKGSFNDYNWPEVFKGLPVVDIPKSMGIDSAQWEGAVDLFRGDVLSEKASIADQYDRISVPIFHITGWNDFLARGTLNVYEGIDRASARRGEAVPQKLIVGPWRHDQIWLQDMRVGDEDFGAKARMGVEKVMDLSGRWFDRWLKGIDNGITKEKPVELFVMGKNAWRRFEQWPPREVEFQKWYLRSEKGANSLKGDGRLSMAPPDGNGQDRFVYDPMDPIPTVGGANFHFFLDNLGPKDQRSVEARKDVLVYTSPPLKKSVTLAGPLKAVIYASTEGRHTDFTAKLVVVREDGYARNIEDGILRGPDPLKGERVSSMEPGKVYSFTIALGATGIRIKKGHRLRVEVSSSNFPKYTRNPNTGESAETARDFLKVTQTVFHSERYPSHVVLPVLK